MALFKASLSLALSLSLSAFEAQFFNPAIQVRAVSHAAISQPSLLSSAIYMYLYIAPNTCERSPHSNTLEEEEEERRRLSLSFSLSRSRTLSPPPPSHFSP